MSVRVYGKDIKDLGTLSRDIIEVDTVLMTIPLFDELMNEYKKVGGKDIYPCGGNIIDVRAKLEKVQ